MPPVEVIAKNPSKSQPVESNPRTWVNKVRQIIYCLTSMYQSQKRFKSLQFKSIIQLVNLFYGSNPMFNITKYILLEVKLHDFLVLSAFFFPDCCYENNANVNCLLWPFIRSRYSHINLMLGVNYRDTNWSSWTILHNKESKEASLIEAIRGCYLHQQLLEPTRSRGSNNPSSICTNWRINARFWYQMYCLTW